LPMKNAWCFPPARTNNASKKKAGVIGTKRIYRIEIKSSKNAKRARGQTVRKVIMKITRHRAEVVKQKRSKTESREKISLNKYEV